MYLYITYSRRIQELTETIGPVDGICLPKVSIKENGLNQNQTDNFRNVFVVYSYIFLLLLLQIFYYW